MSFDGNRWVGFIWVVAALRPTAARAEEPASSQTPPTELIFLDYRATRECPSRDSFLEQVRAYAPRVVLATKQGASRLFKVRVERTARQLKGKLEIRSADTTAQREVSADTCSEVVDALALATALAIDPSLLGSSPAAEPSQPISPPTPSASSPSPPPVALAPPPTQHDLSSVPRESASPQPGEKPPGVRPSWRLGAEALAIWGLLPRAALGPELSLEYDLNNVGRWFPNLILAAFYVASGDLVKHSATIRFAAIAAEARACWPFATSAQVHLDVCPVAVLGSLRSELLHQAAANEGSRTWAALGLAGQVEVALSASLALQFRGALLAHLIHQKVVIVTVASDGTVEEPLAHETTGALAALSAGLTYRF